MLSPDRSTHRTLCGVIAVVVAVLAGVGCRASVETTATTTDRATLSVAASESPTPQAEPSETPVPPTAVPAPATAVPSATAVAVPYRSGAQVLLEDQSELVDGKRIGLIANPASQIQGQSTIDFFAASPDVDLVALFAPEHGVRGDLGAGELVPGGIDAATGVTVHSLYGENRAPTPEQLAEIDVLVYDLQDVGTRFYTFISTMGLAMQAAAAADIDFVVLDRPNPHGYTRSSGFVLEPGFESFVGQYPIPAFYALTAGELAQAIVGEAWLTGLGDLRLTVVPLQGWTRSAGWTGTGDPWVAPSPGLPTIESVLAYPGTVVFEAAPVSVARCTSYTFAAIGGADIDAAAVLAELGAVELAGVEFTTQSVPPCPDVDAPNVTSVRWTVTDPSSFDAAAAGVHALAASIDSTPDGSLIDRPEFLDLLAGTDRLRLMLNQGADPADIVASWVDETVAFDQAMQPYRLYPD